MHGISDSSEIGYTMWGFASCSPCHHLVVYQCLDRLAADCSLLGELVSSPTENLSHQKGVHQAILAEACPVRVHSCRLCISWALTLSASRASPVVDQSSWLWQNPAQWLSCSEILVTDPVLLEQKVKILETFVSSDESDNLLSHFSSLTKLLQVLSLVLLINTIAITLVKIA
ncbi:hypothetical protein PR048_011894 [Dryococelus australis]|uniref:Uncharacterized protein n=1 Tax=Dryococelus australis TaxID=614101 RepID=A0ABQ9HNM2_9NEOP|nr:hypothetical protein PR048_011894 [Dryococelus australis]